MRATRYEDLKRRIRQKEFEIRGLLQHIKNIDEVNDAKNKKLTELQSTKHALEQQMIQREQDSSLSVTKLETAIHGYQSKLQKLTDENVLLKNNLVFCVRIAILLMFVLIITPTIVRIYVENIRDQSMDRYNFVEWEEYQNLKIENEILLSQIEELNDLNSHQLDDGDSYARLQAVQQQLEYTMKQNEYLRKTRNTPQNQVNKIEEMQRLISDKNENLSRYETELSNANNEIKRLQASLSVPKTSEKIIDVSSNTKIISGIQMYIQRPEIIQLLVFFIIAIVHYIVYKLWSMIQNISHDWLFSSYWLQRNERKKWNRGANGRLSSRFSGDFTLSRFQHF